jgi:hypothetical protein
VGELVVILGRLQNRTPPGVNVTLPPIEVFAASVERLGQPQKKGTGRSLAHSVAVIGTVAREPMVLRGCNERGLHFLLENRHHPGGPWGVRPVRRTWLRVVAFGEVARGLDILRRGYSIAVAGQLRPRQLENPDGSTRWLHELVAEHVDFLRFKRVPRAA